MSEKSKLKTFELSIIFKSPNFRKASEIALDFLKNVPYESKINKLEEVVIKTEM